VTSYRRTDSGSNGSPVKRLTLLLLILCSGDRTRRPPVSKDDYMSSLGKTCMTGAWRVEYLTLHDYSTYCTVTYRTVHAYV